MTAVSSGAVDLDRLENLRKTATPGPWVSENGRTIAGDFSDDGWFCVDVAHCPADPADAELIVALVNAAPSLLSAARRATALEQRVQALAEELESFTVNRTPAPGSYDAGVVAAFVNVAARLRRLLADAAPDTGEETA